MTPPPAIDAPQVEWALWWAIEHGRRVFPLAHGLKFPPPKGWQRRATTDPTAIERLWRYPPYPNIAGICDDWLVVDVDVWSVKHNCPKPGAESFERLKADMGGWPDTLTNRTASGGLHYIFDGSDRPAGEFKSGPLDRIKYPGIDIKTGPGAYIVLPNSFISGGSYCRG